MTTKIVTHYDPPPIPDRRHDWCAVGDDYEPGLPIGHGRTEGEAIADFIQEFILWREIQETRRHAATSNTVKV